MNVVGQLLYTSCDSLDDGPGGWRVKEQLGMDDTDSALALELVIPSMELPQELPRFPSRSLTERLPRRLAARQRSDGALVVVHSAPAGADASGRPGNVVNHALVLRRDPGAGDLHRAPVPCALELWRSPDWRTPWGHEAVAAVSLAAATEPVRLGGTLSVDAAAVFGASSGPRSRAIGALVDGLSAALAGGPPVAVLVDDQDAGVLLLYSALLFVEPSTRAAVSFSTWERAYDLRDAPLLPHVALVPRADGPQLAGLGLVVLDPERQDAPEEDSWPTALPGPDLRVTPWSALVMALCGLSGEDLSERLTAIGEIAQANPRVGGSVLWFPAALAVYEFELPAQTAAQDLLLHVRLELLDEAQAEKDVRAAQERALGRTASDAARALERLHRSPLAEDDVMAKVHGIFLTRLLSADAGISGHWPPALPAVDVDRLPGVLEVTAAAVSTAIASASAAPLSPTERAARVLRLLDIAHRLAVHVHLSSVDVEAAVTEAVEVLLEDTGAEALRRSEPLLASTAQSLSAGLQRRLVEAAGLPGTRLPHHVRRWLLDGLLPVMGMLPDGLRGELAVLGVPDLANFAPWRRDAVVAILSSGWTPHAGATAEERTSSALTRWGRGSAWHAEDLLHLHARLAPVVGVDLRDRLLAALEATPPATSLSNRLADALLELHHAGPSLEEPALSLVVALHHLREGMHLVGPEEKPTTVDLLVSGLNHELDEEAHSAPVAALRPHLLVAAVQVLAWEATGTGSALDLRRQLDLAGLACELPLVSVAFREALVLLLEAFEHPTHGAQLSGPVLRAISDHVLAGRGESLWSTRLHPSAAALGGRQTFGEALLHSHLRRLPAPRRWLHEQLRCTELWEATTRPTTEAWARALVAGCAPDDEPAPAPT